MMSRMGKAAARAARAKNSVIYREVLEIRLDFGGEDKFHWKYPVEIKHEHFQVMKKRYERIVEGKSYEELDEMFQDLFKYRNSVIDKLVYAVWGHETFEQITGKVGEIIVDCWPMQLLLRERMAQLKGLTLEDVNGVAGGTIQ